MLADVVAIIGIFLLPYFLAYILQEASLGSNKSVLAPLKDIKDISI